MSAYTTAMEQGLRLHITDREMFAEVVNDVHSDPALMEESWGENRVPADIFIDRYKTDPDEPNWYHVFNQHRNGEYSWAIMGEDLFDALFDAGVIEDTDDFDVDLVHELQERHDNNNL